MNYLEKIISESQFDRIKKGTLTGSHIIVYQNGNYLLNETFGYRSVNKEPLSKNSIYRIASMTKPITSVALLIEQEKGRLNINDFVSDYIPEFENMNILTKDGRLIAAKKKISLYMLVSHISGINSSALEGYNNPMPMPTRNLKNVTEYTATQPLSFEPGSSQEYNTIGYDIAARIIEITSGLDFEEYLKQNLFNKLGMSDTTFKPTDDQWKRCVCIHDKKNNKAVDLTSENNSVIDGYPVTYYAAGCALVSTASDYFKFAQMLINNGKNSEGDYILSPESIKLLSTPVVDDIIMPGSQKWGLGVRVITDDKYILPQNCYGWSGKYGSHFWIDPSNNLIALYMKNSSYDGGAGCKTGIEFEKNVMKYLSKCK